MREGKKRRRDSKVIQRYLLPTPGTMGRSIIVTTPLPGVAALRFRLRTRGGLPGVRDMPLVIVRGIPEQAQVCVFLLAQTPRARWAGVHAHRTIALLK